MPSRRRGDGELGRATRASSFFGASFALLSSFGRAQHSARHGFGSFVEDALAHTEAAAPPRRMVTGVEWAGDRVGVAVTKAVPPGTLLGERPAYAWPQVVPTPLSLGSEVKIFVHRVPRCAGERALQVLEHRNTRGPQNRAAKHMRSIHRAVLRSGAIVKEPERATLFYIPAYFKVLVELMESTDLRRASTGGAEHLDCIALTWSSIDQRYLMRNGGFDHFVIGGYHSTSGAFERDWTSYHPLARNAINLVAGVPSYGHPDVVFRGETWHALREIFVPHSASPFCCATAEAALAPAAAIERDVAVALDCTLTSRTRALIRAAQDDPDWPFYGDSRVAIRVEKEVQTADGEPQAADISDLYRRSTFCLVVVGNLMDLTYRFYDVVRFGCLPVVLTHEPLVVAAPFAAVGVDYPAFTHFAHIGSHRDVTRVVQKLVALASDADGLAVRRQALLQHAPRLFFQHQNCTAGLATAMDALLVEFAVRQRALSSTRFVGGRNTI